jgi:hypothetical protein
MGVSTAVGEQVVGTNLSASNFKVAISDSGGNGLLNQSGTNDLGVHIGGSSRTAVAQGVAVFRVIKGSPGRVAKAIVTTAGTTSLLIYDNASAASGVVLFAFPTSTAVGTIFDIQMPATAGIVVDATTATTPAFTLSWS